MAPAIAHRRLDKPLALLRRGGFERMTTPRQGHPLDSLDSHLGVAVDVGVQSSGGNGPVRRQDAPRILDFPVALF
jgi:hypothetical protein